MSSEIPDQATLHPYQLFMLPLCFYTLGGMVADALVKFDNSTRAILEYADIAVCAIFFLDFLISLANAQNKLRYFFTWGWIDLASSIPTIDVYVGDAQLVY